MTKTISGIIPVAITPFTYNDEIDWDGYAELIEWYIAHGAEGLFAVCQSSEMQFLSLDERVELARYTMERVAGRIPVVASGHVSAGIKAQKQELTAIAETGIDGLVLVTNRLASADQGTEVFKAHLDELLDCLPDDLTLGLYECPAPFRRLLSDEEISYCVGTGRFALLKDVSCDLETVKRRVALTAGTPLAIVNANAAIAWPAMRAGSAGFCGVFTNIHPDLYRWLEDYGSQYPEFAEELSVFLVLAACTEPMGYPKLAKLYHQRLGTFSSIHSRTIPFDIHERFWALDAIVDRIEQGTGHFRSRIAALDEHE